MKGRIYENRTGLCLLALLVSFLFDSHLVIAEPEPAPPGMVYSDIEDPEEMVLLNRLRTIVRRKQEAIEQEKDLTEEQIAIQAILDAKARNQRGQQTIPEEFSMEDSEALPVPSAIFNHGPQYPTGKRTSYMTLCHFKICNMGRKRQL